MSSNWIRKEKREKIYTRDGHTCIYCEAKEHLSLDHIKPQSMGGSNTESNLLTACISCNTSRQDTEINTFINTFSNPSAIRRRIAIAISRRIK